MKNAVITMNAAKKIQASGSVAITSWATCGQFSTVSTVNIVNSDVLKSPKCCGAAWWKSRSPITEAM